MQTFCLVAFKDDAKTAGFRDPVNGTMKRVSDTLGSLSPVTGPSVDEIERFQNHAFDLFYLTNEPTTNLVLSDDGDRAFLKIGHSGRSPQEFFEPSGFLNLSNTQTASGCFGIVGVFEENAVLVTDAVGSHIFFVAEDQDSLVISNRMTVAYAVSQVIKGKDWTYSPDYDLGAVRGFAAAGHFNFKSTAFENVNAVNLGTVVEVRSGRSVQWSWTDKLPVSEASDGSEYDSLVSEVAEAIVQACGPIADQENTMITLTGGRDSRLVAAAMAQYEVKPRSSTYGNVTDPDVHIASIISKKFGWEHRISEPKQASDNVEEFRTYLVENIDEKVNRILDVFSLETSAWDDSEAYGPYLEPLHISGVGGELLRGGYSATRKTLPTENEAKARVNSILRGDRFLIAAPSIDEIAIANSYLSIANSNPLLALDLLYKENRNVRWVAARRRGARFRRNTFDPLMDNRIVAQASRINLDLRWSEKLVFDVIDKLAPSLSEVPIEGSPWRFEDPDFQGQKVEVEGSRSTLRKQPLPNAIPSYDPRKLEDDNYRQSFLRSFDERMNSRSITMIDREEFHRVVNEDLRYPTTAWHALTALSILSDDWMQPHRKNTVDRSIEIKVKTVQS